MGLVRFARDREVCSFEMDYDLACDALRRCRDSKRLGEWLAEQQHRDNKPIDLPFLDSIQLKCLINPGNFAAICKQCNAKFNSDEIRVEKWHYNKGPLATGNGRNLFCPRGHLLARLIDQIS